MHGKHSTNHHTPSYRLVKLGKHSTNDLINNYIIHPMLETHLIPAPSMQYLKLSHRNV